MSTPKAFTFITSTHNLIMALQDEKKVDIETEHAEHAVDTEQGEFEKIDVVPSIEEAAASRAAWLIAVTVSLGGFVSLAFSWNH